MTHHARILLLAIALSIGRLGATTLADFQYLSRGEISPEGWNVTFGDNELWQGRVHTNGQAQVSVFGLPVFAGFFTQGAAAVVNLSVSQYPQVFQVGWAFPYAQAVWPTEDALHGIREACSPEHRWPAMEEGDPLTTLMRFDHDVYRVAQYFTRQTSPGDTAFHLPWATLPLPQPPAAEPLIWVEGVARLKGVVSGELTVLVSDSLFLMGDLIVDGTVLDPCGDEELFGTVPADSPHRIGLIGEKDVIVAATLENGFANGALSPAVDCGLPSDDPVVAVCGQGRRDIVITAAILAAGCSFEAEVWETTARNAIPPDSSLQVEVCGGWSHTHVRIWSESECPGVAAEEDRRGTVWLHGSIANGVRGYIVRTPVGGWGGDVWIGYNGKRYRWDDRLALRPPPRWPELTWEPQEDQPPYALPAVDRILVLPGACGQVTDTTGFRLAFELGWMGLRLFRDEDLQRLPVHLRLRSDSAILADSFFVVEEGFTEWRPRVDPLQALRAGERVWLSVEGDFLFDNRDGEDCFWTLDEVAVEPAPSPRPSTPALGVPYPNPFNPATRVTVTLARPETVRLALVDLLGREARVVREGPLPAGEHAISVDGAGLPSGLYLLRLEHGGGAVEARKALLLR